MSITATWTIELNCECPHCEEYVKLLDDSDFLRNNEFEIGEHGIDRTRNFEVWCPECGESFEVDLEY